MIFWFWGNDYNLFVFSKKDAKIINSKVVVDAMKNVDRGNYCTNQPYFDSPQSIGIFEWMNEQKEKTFGKSL